MIINVALTNSDTSYNIIIDKLKDLDFNTKVVLITNITVSKLHLSYLEKRFKVKELSVLTIPDGEKFKNMDTINMILNHCFEKKLDRKSMLIAFGGGVIGDMTGFAASIYQRGISFIQIPTTLLAQVDSSVGGKTGINNKYGKNLIGTFYQPKTVLIDTYFLTTLPKKQFAAGVAEIIKMSVIFDDKFFLWLEQHDLAKEENIKKAIKKAIKIKADVVIKDEKESGIRAALNYGHTFGHVIEKETNYNTFLHGEAVAIGMVMANELAIKLGIMNKDDGKRVKNMLRKYDLPISYNIKNVEDFYNHFFLDKKVINNKIKFILPKAIGDFIITNEVSKEDTILVLNGFSK